MTTPITRREIPYPRHKVALATIPLYAAAFIPLLALGSHIWLVVILWLLSWICIDLGMSRFFIWQVNSRRRPVWKSLAVIAAIGLAADLVVVAAIYLLFPWS